MNNKTQPTPEQLAKWREDAVRFYVNAPIDHEYLGHSDYYIAGYLRAKQENEQIMKLAKFGATLLTIGAVYQSFYGIETGILTPDGESYAPNIEATIEELLK